MTAFTVGDDAASGGGLSANALAVGAESNLVFTMRILGLPTTNVAQSATLFSADGIIANQKTMRLNKADVLQNVKVATSHIGTTATGIEGNMKLVRGDAALATFPFAIPPAGQIPAPTNTAVMTPNAASTIRTDVTKLLKIRAVRKDASGKTTAGGETSVWLGKGSTRHGEPAAILDYDTTGNWGNNVGTGPDREVSVIPYDQLADKEGAAGQYRLSWPLGPFVSPANETVYFGASTSGNLPVGTIVQFMYVYQAPNGTYLAASPVKNFTIDASGGVVFNPAAGSVVTLECAKGSYGMKSVINCYRRVFYKLSTQSKWTDAGGDNANQTIANPFTEGPHSTPGTSVSFSSVMSVNVALGISGGPIDGSPLSGRVAFKVWADGKQVQGPGTNYNSANGQGWPFTLTNSINSGGTGYNYIYINVNNGDTWQNNWPAYSAGAFQGDQYYTANQPVAISIAVPSRINVTGLEIYVQQYTTTNGVTTVENLVPYSIVYDGPYVANFDWTGQIVTSNVGIPATNTTASYPATLLGNFSWDASNAEEFVVLPGDQLFCELTAGTLNVKSVVQLSVPIEFLS